ncbi:hypothetical protein PG991_003121 [Apiospora marii]|uniref:Uncharacterized protein n=2 Tax=Apiospora marii TaxID=335849 RepID=A0ABR1SJM3_9PEZI
MPSTTSLSRFSFHNAGPLTTTYTAPASCMTAQPTQLMLGPTTEPDTFYYGGCSFQQDNCYPSGVELDALRSKSDVKVNNKLDYFSPGLHCPENWTTVGMATKNAEGVITSSGPAFTYPGSTITGILDRTGGTVMTTAKATLSDDMKRFGYAGHHALLGAMDHGETAILCCPSSMTARALNGVCFAALPSVEVPRSVCFVGSASDYTTGLTQLSIFGTTVSGRFNQATATGPLSTQTTALPEKVRSELLAYTIMPIVALVHRESDTFKHDNDTETTDEGAPLTTTTTSSSSSAAMAGRSSAFQMAFLGGAWPWVSTTLLAGVAAGFALVLV